MPKKRRSEEANLKLTSNYYDSVLHTSREIQFGKVQSSKFKVRRGAKIAKALLLTRTWNSPPETRTFQGWPPPIRLGQLQHRSFCHWHWHWHFGTGTHLALVLVLPYWQLSPFTALAKVSVLPAVCFLPTVHHPPPTTRYPPPTIHYPLPTYRYLPNLRYPLAVLLFLFLYACACHCLDHCH